MPRPAPTFAVLRARYEARVDRSDPDGCWPWTGQKQKDNRYGVTPWYPAKGGRLAHRVAYALAHRLDPLTEPVGMEVGHRCHRPDCVRPDHLYACTREENERDKDNAGRRPTGVQDHLCRKCGGPRQGRSRRGNGREFAFCVPCMREYQRERHAARRDR